jgi:hypothetical protein
MPSASQDILLHGWEMDVSGLGFYLMAIFPTSGTEPVILL